MRIVLDTNVLISALFKKESTSAQILDLWRQQTVELLVSSEGLAEIDRVLTYPKVQKRLVYNDGEVQKFLDLLRRASIVIHPDPMTPVVKADPDDDKFVALALSGHAQYLISGDGHLLDIGHVGELLIVTPRNFLEWWQVQEAK
jgi:putative PIN family toxin of toxin-antitoxin system